MFFSSAFFRKFRVAVLIVVVIAVGVWQFQSNRSRNGQTQNNTASLLANLIQSSPVPTSQPTQALQPTPALLPLPPSKILSNDYHIFQTFNNCGPAALSMALSYYNIQVSQQTLRDMLRPYNNPQGDNDDKSVTLDELANKGTEYGFIAYHRPNGTPELVKQFINHDIPVITETLLKTDDDIGHYRVIKGYDDTTQEFIQDDSLQGKNLRYTYSAFDQLWKTYSYGYLVLIPADKAEIAEAIIGDDVLYHTAWVKAVERSKLELERNPNDAAIGFNLAVGLYNIGEYQAAVEQFERVEQRIPRRTLWYQIEPILGYYHLGNDQRVMQLIDQVLNDQNKAFSELYVIRGNVYKRQGNLVAARSEYEKAILYNRHLKSAQDALYSL